MDTRFKEAFDYKVIYVFTILDEAHKGLLKIGDATVETESPIDKLPPNCHELNQAALKRIRSYTNTAGLNPKLLHTELAVRQKKNKDGSVSNEAFRDHQVHDVLKNSGIKNVKFDGSTGQEWYRIDLETAKKAIDAVKNYYANLSNSSSSASEYTPIIFRPEQEDCIKKAVKHFKKADRFLVNAKMRYGKTLVSLEIVKECKFNKTIIMTHRPVVNAGWYEDFTKIFYDENDIIYGSKDNGYTVEKLLNTGKRFIYFASIQDLRGSSEVGGKFNKNDAVFSTHWDCVIVDEAHEGTTTALGEETVKAVVKEGSGTKFLALSGTPFNILTDYDENSIYTWDYIMEQECKYGWDDKHFGDHNPYDDLPELRIYTYSLGDILHNSNYITYEDKAFNFREFFRTFTGDYKADYADMPEGAEVGDFVHEADVWSFLNLMTKEDEQSGYPYSNEEYRNIFKHSLWMVPGVREAHALKKLMLKHPVFGSGQFDIVNVAGNGDRDEESEDALNKVKNAIRSAKKSGTYTITLSCGKLTTGVTVKDWTAVFMLAGSYSTSAANYLQTIFRVQSPCSDNGKVKDRAYVFDFAPDRTLKMISSAVQVSSKAGKTKESDKRIMGKFLNYCPVISVSGSQMHEYSTNRLLQQLKRAYADKVVRNGFDDSKLYNDELLKLDKVDIEKFDKLKGIIGKSKAAPKANDITINDQGLTDEEYEEQEKLQKKKKKDLTPEEKARLEELKKKKKVRSDAISILRGISIRMPLLIYGADIPYDEEVTLDKFVDIVDDSSWKEFMPKGVTKRIFRDFQKYYDEEIFIAAGRKIRNISREADTLEPTERVKKIAGLFSYFKNPDKETVLTPWRVVNMHMSDCLGGWCFFDETFEEDNTLDNPRFVDRGKVTEDVFGKLDAQILEINSKTGLYPLYAAYSVYRTRLKEYDSDELNVQELQEIWGKTVKENIFAICKTPMAKSITQRTLVGYSRRTVNAHYFDNLVNSMKNKSPQFIKRILKESYWKKGKGVMKFDAIVGNPPFQETGGSGGTNDAPIYQDFAFTAEKLNPTYISLIMQARWFSGGRKSLLEEFRHHMLTEGHINKLYVYPESHEIFPTVDIKSGICYYLQINNYNGKCNYYLIENGVCKKYERDLSEMDILIRDPRLATIVKKVTTANESNGNVDTIISGDTPFGIGTKPEESKKNRIKLYGSKGKSHDTILLYNVKQERKTAYVNRSEIKKNTQDIDAVKVFIPKASGSGNDPNVLGKPEIFPANSVCSQTYNYAAFKSLEEASNFVSYLKTKFFRAIVSAIKISQDAPSSVYRYVPMQDYSHPWSDQMLYKKYSLTSAEIEFIESLIDPMS